MLRESYVSQKEKNTYRRWFEDDYFDLIVWYNKENNSISGFQLCYDKKRDEHAFTWHKTAGFSHNRIDDSRGISRRPGTPILVADGYFPFSDIVNKFNNNSDNVDSDIKNLVTEKLTEYSNK